MLLQQLTAIFILYTNRGWHQKAPPRAHHGNPTRYHDEMRVYRNIWRSPAGTATETSPSNGHVYTTVVLELPVPPTSYCDNALDGCQWRIQRRGGELRIKRLRRLQPHQDLNTTVTKDGSNTSPCGWTKSGSLSVCMRVYLVTVSLKALNWTGTVALVWSWFGLYRNRFCLLSKFH